MAENKTYLLDTNVLIQDPEAIFKFYDNEVVIPDIVIEELDKLKKKVAISVTMRENLSEI